MADRFNFSWTRLHLEDIKLLTAIQTGVIGLRQDIQTLSRQEKSVRTEIATLVDAIGPLVEAVTKLRDEAATEHSVIDSLKAKIDAGGKLSPDEQKALADAASKVTELTRLAIDGLGTVAPAAAAAEAAAAAPAPAAAAPATDGA